MLVSLIDSGVTTEPSTILESSSVTIVGYSHLLSDSTVDSTSFSFISSTTFLVTGSELSQRIWDLSDTSLRYSVVSELWLVNRQW